MLLKNPETLKITGPVIVTMIYIFIYFVQNSPNILAQWCFFFF